MNKKQISSVAWFIFLKNIKKISYWTVLIWPITLGLCYFLIYKQVNVHVNSSHSSLVIIMCIFSLFITFFLGNIIGNEFVIKKTSKINEYLASFVKTRNLFWGNLIGVTYILLFSISIYCFVYYSLSYYFPFINNYLLSLIGNYSIIGVFIDFLNITILILWILVAASILGMHSNTEKQLSKRLFYIYFYIILAAWGILKLKTLSTVKMSFNFIPVFSQFNCIPTIAYKNFNNFIFLIIQVIILTFVVNFANRKYSQLF